MRTLIAALIIMSTILLLTGCTVNVSVVTHSDGSTLAAESNLK